MHILCININHYLLILVLSDLISFGKMLLYVIIKLKIYNIYDKFR